MGRILKIFLIISGVVIISFFTVLAFQNLNSPEEIVKTKKPVTEEDSENLIAGKEEAAVDEEEVIIDERFEEKVVDEKEIEEKDYPIRWIDEGEIKEVKDADLSLEKEVCYINYAGDTECVEVKLHKAGEDSVIVNNCKDYLYYIDKEFFAGSTYEMAMESWFMGTCHPIKYFQKAVSAKKSYVSDFNLMDHSQEMCVLLFGEESSSYALLNPSCRLFHKLEKEDSTLSKISFIWEREEDHIYEELGIIKKKGEPIQRLVFEILGWGDFNQDGLEDVLLQVLNINYDGSWRGSDWFFVITKNKEEKISIVNINF